MMCRVHCAYITGEAVPRSVLYSAERLAVSMSRRPAQARRRSARRFAASSIEASHLVQFRLGQCNFIVTLRYKLIN